MLLEQIHSRFNNLSQDRELKYYLGTPATEPEILKTEQRLGVSFPAQVESFYKYYNGLRVDDPQLEILPIERLTFALPNRLHFATVDNNRHLFFDVSAMNAADQWTVVTADDFQVTLTMASFWSIRMWTWIEKRRPIWVEPWET
jgi:hypothetical protein